MEAHWQTNPEGKGAAWKILAWPDKKLQGNTWAIELPYALSLITTLSPTGRVTGLHDIPIEDQPPLLLPFYSFRIMLGIGIALVVLMLWSLWAWRKGELVSERIGRQKWLLWSWVAAIPLSYIAMEAGWVVREVGRQPWVIQGVLRTEQGVSRLPPETVAGSLLGFMGIYCLLFILFLVFARRLLNNGPDFSHYQREKAER
jgi:cytochrome d ubiquinol oxidase subunit I